MRDVQGSGPEEHDEAALPALLPFMDACGHVVVDLDRYPGLLEGLPRSGQLDGLVVLEVPAWHLPHSCSQALVQHCQQPTLMNGPRAFPVVAIGDPRVRAERYLACVAAPPKASVLRLDPAATVRTWEDGRYQRTLEHHFLDFTIDGRSLRDIANEPDMVTPLSRPWLEDVPTEVERLLGRRDTDVLSAGRAALLICRVDGDIACGALTARVHISNAQVGWTDWLWETDLGGLPVEIDPGDFLFDRTAYEAELAAAFAAVQKMPYDELSHRGKGLLWPWEWSWRMPPRDA